jgi:uncharacterized protein YukE
LYYLEKKVLLYEDNMPSGVHANPEDIEQFARDLVRFNTDLASMCSSLKGKFRRLGENWDDQEFRKYEQTFDQTLRSIQTYLKTSEAQIPMLQKKARVLRDYLNR